MHTGWLDTAQKSKIVSVKSDSYCNNADSDSSVTSALFEYYFNFYRNDALDFKFGMEVIP